MSATEVKVPDVGDFKDIHPKNKQEVGRRLALLALAKTYGIKLPAFTGPQFKSFATRISAAGIIFYARNMAKRQLTVLVIAAQLRLYFAVRII